MLLKRKVDAGVLIYAMLMAVLFTLLLQFYLDRLVASQRQSLVMEENSQAYLMAQMAQTAYGKHPEEQQFQFNLGQARVDPQGNHIAIDVVVADTGHHYEFDFLSSKPQSSHQTKKSSSSSLSSSSSESKESSKKEKTDSSRSSQASESSSTSALPSDRSTEEYSSSSSSLPSATEALQTP